MTWSKKLRHLILLALAPSLGYLAVRFLALTMRLRVLNQERVVKFWKQGQAVIVAFWHGRLLMMPLLREKGRVHTLLVSQHRDGEYIGRMVAKFHLMLARGSTTRGSRSGIRELFKAFKAGSDLVITPDGPQGPREVVQPGVVELARVTGAPICPVTFGASRKKILASWDGFLIPYPFSRGLFLWGQPMVVPRDSSKEELDEFRHELQVRMREMNHLVDSFFKKRARPGAES